MLFTGRLVGSILSYDDEIAMEPSILTSFSDCVGGSGDKKS